MRNWIPKSSVTTVLVTLASLLLSVGAFAQNPSGTLIFYVVVVDELTPKPVPLADFRIVAASDA
jgi:hypothetical protein